MKKLTGKNISLHSLLLAGFLCAAAQPAHAVANDKKVLLATDGRVVHARLSGTCVRTIWNAGNDACAPLPPPEKVAVVAPPPPPPAPKPVMRVVQQRTEVLDSEERKIYFNFDSAELTPGAKEKLDMVATKLSQASSVKGAEIVGYTDRMGSNSYNVALSKKRAEAVHNYLTGRGYLDTHVADVRGLGKANSVTNCGSQGSREQKIECLGADRRVELEVNYSKPVVTNVVVEEQQASYQAPMPTGQLLYTSTAPNSY